MPSVSQHGDTHDEAEGEDPVDDTSPKLRARGEVFVEVQRLRVHGQRVEQHVVHLGHGAPQAVPHTLPDPQIVEIQTSHHTPSDSVGRQTRTASVRLGQQLIHLTQHVSLRLPRSALAPRQ